MRAWHRAVVRAQETRRQVTGRPATGRRKQTGFASILRVGSLGTWLGASASVASACAPTPSDYASGLLRFTLPGQLDGADVLIVEPHFAAELSVGDQTTDRDHRTVVRNSERHGVGLHQH